MKKIIFFVIASLLGVIASNAQFIPPRDKNLNEIKRDAEIYFKRLHEQMSDEDFYHEGSEYNEYMRFLQTWEPRLVGHGDFKKYFLNEKIVLGQDRATGVSANCPGVANWWELGPYNSPIGTMSSNGGSHTGTGPIEFIVINKNLPNNMLCGSMSGGLFYTTNSGNNWQNAGGDDTWSKTGCAAAAYHPTLNTTWYAVSNGWGPYFGWSGGVYRTTNSGTAWTKVGDANTFGVWCNAYSITVDPVNANNAVVGTNDGLFATTNLNAANVVWDSYGTRKFPGDMVYDVENRPGTNNELYATVATGTIQIGNGTYGTNWELWKSLDFGQTWSQITGLPASFSNCINLTMEFNKNLPNKIYFSNDRNLGSCSAVYNSTCDRSDELWTYNITGNSWSMIDSHLSVLMGGGHGFGVANSGSSEIVYEAYVDRYRVYDNGTWTLYNTAQPNYTQYHVDVEDFVTHPTTANEVWMACHGGVFKSIDKGVTWIDKSDGIGVAEILGMSTSYTNPEFVLLGLYHDGSILTQTGYFNNWVPDWYLKGEGDGQQTLIDNFDPTYMYVSSQGGSWNMSTNTGASFSGGVGYVPANWGTEGVLNRIDPKIFYRPSGGNGEVYRSFDRGANNQVASNFATLVGGTYNAYAVYSCENFYSRMYAQLLGPASHILCMSTDINNPNVATAINSWMQLPVPSTILNSCSGNTNFYFNDLFPDLDNINIVYLTSNSSSSCINQPNGTNMVIKADYTIPNSPVFTDLTFDLPNTNAGQIVVEKGADGALYVATDLGVYYTNNKRIASATYPIWCHYGPNLPHAAAVDLDINYQINKIRVGLSGRGVWENTLNCPTDFDETYANITHPAALYREVTHDITSAAIVSSSANVSYRGGNQIHLLPGFHANAGSKFHAFIHRCSTPGNSFRSYVVDEMQFEEESEDESAMLERPPFTLYPNPANDNITVALADSRKSITELIIYDMSGRLLKSYGNFKSMSGDKITIDISDLSKGFFVIEIVSHDDRIRTEFIKSE